MKIFEFLLQDNYGYQLNNVMINLYTKYKKDEDEIRVDLKHILGLLDFVKKEDADAEKVFFNKVIEKYQENQSIRVGVDVNYTAIDFEIID